MNWRVFSKAFFMFLFLFLLNSSASFGADACSTNNCITKIRSLVIDPGGIWIKTTVSLYGSSSIPIVNCIPDSKVFLRLLKTHPNFGPIYTALMSAQLTGQSIGIRINEATNPCTVSYVTVGE